MTIHLNIEDFAAAQTRRPYWLILPCSNDKDTSKFWWKIDDDFGRPLKTEAKRTWIEAAAEFLRLDEEMPR